MARWYCPSRFILLLHNENIRDQFEARTQGRVGPGVWFFTYQLVALPR